MQSIDLTIARGEFVAIIGDVGSGKSSLISSLVGEMLPVSSKTFEKFKNFPILGSIKTNIDYGKQKELHQLNQQLYNEFNEHREYFRNSAQVHVKGSISLVEQTPWVLNATIRDNILFGEPMDEEKYCKVIEICQLVRDLEILEGGDLTQIGEKGINLSGGQKARIAIARSVYADSDIFIMDDPFSALDAHVKKRIFDEVFCNKLRYKTRIIVTHAIDFLDKVDRIIVLDKGNIIHNGVFEDLKHMEYFNTIIKRITKDEILSEEKTNEIANTNELSKYEDLKLRKNYLSLKGSTITSNENEEKTKVDWKLHLKYLTFSRVTILMSFLALVFLIVSGACGISFDYYLLKWIKDASQSRELHWNTLQNTIILALIVALIEFTSGIIHLIFLFSVSINLFNEMMNKICHAPMNTYFDKTPSGVIMNKFSKDFDLVENRLPNIMRAQIIGVITITSTV